MKFTFFKDDILVNFENVEFIKLIKMPDRVFWKLQLISGAEIYSEEFKNVQEATDWLLDLFKK